MLKRRKVLYRKLLAVIELFSTSSKSQSSHNCHCIIFDNTDISDSFLPDFYCKMLLAQTILFYKNFEINKREISTTYFSLFTVIDKCFLQVFHWGHPQTNIIILTDNQQPLVVLITPGRLVGCINSQTVQNKSAFAKATANNFLVSLFTLNYTL